MEKRYLLSFILLMAGSMVQAQSNMSDFNLFLGAPQGDFADNLDRTAVGIDAAVAFAIPESIIKLGFEFGIMTYGVDSRRESFNPSIPEVTVRVETDYDIATLHGFLRFESPNQRITPYLDALVGFKYLFTRTTIEDNGSYDTIASDTNFDDFAFSYGFGPGIRFLVSEKENNSYYLNLKTRYLFGSEAEYLQPGSITITGGELNFDSSRSTTDLLQIHLGLAVSF